MKSHCIMFCRPVFWPMCCLVLLFFLVMAPDARAQMRLGIEIPENEPVVRLNEVIQNPSEFNGKKIVMKGVVSGQCPALCEFTFRDGVHTATIFPQGYKFPRLPQGRPVTIYTQVVTGRERILLSALGLQTE